MLENVANIFIIAFICFWCGAGLVALLKLPEIAKNLARIADALTEEKEKK